MKPVVATFVLAVLLGGPALVRKSLQASAAQGPESHPAMMNPGPPGMMRGGEPKWWKNPDLVQKLNLSDEQVKKLDKIAQERQIQDVDLRADLRKQEIALESQMEKDPPDEAQVLAQVDKVTQARANLEKSHVEMMLAVRHVLTAEQAKKLRDLDHPAGMPPQGFGPHGPGPERGPGGPPEGSGPPDVPPGPPPNGEAN